MMFHLRSSRSEPLGMSKSDILRGIITEKLSTAAREILAVVERTVADYEAESSGLRRQLELLQPEVRLRRAGVESGPRVHEGGAAGGKPEARTVRQTHFLHWEDGEKDDDDYVYAFDDDEDDEQQTEISALHLDPKDPEYRLPSRSLQPEKRRPSRPQIGPTQESLTLKIRLLEDPETVALSNAVFQKSPTFDLDCPCGLQEKDFEDLLRSTFPPLASEQPFDFFIIDRRKKLHPLRPKSVTPEEVYLAVKSVGNSCLYIRPKKSETAAEKLLGSSGANCRASSAQSLDAVRGAESEPRADDGGEAASGAQEVTHGELGQENAARVNPHQGNRPQISDPNLKLKIRFLEDCDISVLSNLVFQKSPSFDLRCHRSLSEADFSDVLKLAFPQLASGRPFSLFLSDRSRRLQPLQVKTLRPEEIYEAIRSAGNSSLYVQLKKAAVKEEVCSTPAESAGTKKEELRQSSEPNADGGGGVAASEHGHSEEEEELSGGGDQMMSEEEMVGEEMGRDEGRSPDSEAQAQDAAFEDSLGVLSEKGVLARSLPEKEEAGANDKDPDWSLDSEKAAASSCSSSTKWTVEGKMTCRVCGLMYAQVGSLLKHTWTHVTEQHVVCGVCGEAFASAEELKQHLEKYRKVHRCPQCDKTFVSASTLRFHMSRHTGTEEFKCGECNKVFMYRSTLHSHREQHADVKPFQCGVCLKSFALKTLFTAHTKIHNKEPYQCKVCDKSLSERPTFIRHMKLHCTERRFACETCGKRFKLPKGLTQHRKTHTVQERPYLCHICCKTFATSSSLKTHIKTHSGARPFVCAVCGKGFPARADLSKHASVHSNVRPHACSVCGRCFRLKCNLNSHLKTHSGVKTFTCPVCGKGCLKREYLKVHMRTHSGERPYSCSLCEKAFTQSHCLKTHMRIHQSEQRPLLEPSESPMAATDT